MNAKQFFRGNGRAVVIGEKIFINSGSGLSYLCSPNVPEEVTNTLDTKKFSDGPAWEEVSGMNLRLDEIEIGETCFAWPGHIAPRGGCDVLKRIA